MGLLYPWMLSLSVLIAAFILLYFFRKQFERKTISANFLWHEVMAEWEAQPWLYKLQHNLLFWLQLFALLFLLGAIVRPFWYGEGVKGEEIIFVVDTSATLGAQGHELSLFEENKDKMREMVRKLENQPVTIITTGNPPAIVLRNERMEGKILAAIDGLEINYEHEHIEKALQLARGLGHEQTAIYLFTDGIDKDVVAELMDGFYVEVHNSGKNIKNVSLRSFGVGKTNDDVGAVAYIVNEADRNMQIIFTIRHGEEELYKETVELARGEEKMLTIAGLARYDYYMAEITSDDDYPADNQYIALYRDTAPAVIAAGNINPFLVRGLETFGTDVTQFESLEQSVLEEDGILLTNGAEVITEPGQPTLFVAPFTEELQEIQEPVEQRDDELLNYVNMANVFISGASGQAFSELETIVQSGEIPLIQKGVINGQPVVAILFPIEASDWPLHANFPIFLYNAYEWMKQQQAFLGYFQPGEEKWLGQITAENIDIYTLEGEHLYSLDLTEETFRAPEQPGPYQAKYGDEISLFSVILDERERTFQHVEHYVLNEELLGEGERDLVRKEDLWLWLAGVSLLILLIEWEVYRRYA